MSLSEEVLRRAALACYRNAESLYDEARLLLKHGRDARAVVLAVIGLEEFAKAVVYTLAALLPEQRHILLERRTVLNFHQAKHLIASSAEYAQIVSKDYVEGIEWETGYSMSEDEYLATLFEELGRRGLGELIGTVADAKEFYQTLVKEADQRDIFWRDLSVPKFVPEIERKDAGL